jgi:hypothetical protein
VSHAIEFSPQSADCKIRDLHALERACKNILYKGEPALQLRLPGNAVIGEDGQLYDQDTGIRIDSGKMHYRTWKTDHGKWVGDYPQPEGMTADETGNNGVAVIALAGKAAEENPQAYEIGLIARQDEQGTNFSMVHDFYGGGLGLEKFVGPTVKDRNQKVTDAHGDLLMHYQMACTQMAAEELGHSIEFEQNQDGTYDAVVDRENQGVLA